MQAAHERLKNAIATADYSACSDFSIYWGKKNAQIAAAIIDTYATENSIILDPFIGSGSSLYGYLRSKSSAKFYGVDVNEQPIEQIKFNLAIADPKLVKLSLENFRRSNSFDQLYDFKYMGETYRFNKADLDLEPIRKYNSIEVINNSRKIKLNSSSGQIFKIAKEFLSGLNSEKSFTDDLILYENSRIAVNQGMKLSDLYPPQVFNFLLNTRNLMAKDSTLRGVVSSILHLLKYTDKGSQSQFPYWYPKKGAIERNPILLIEKKFIEILKNIKLDNLEIEPKTKSYNLIIDDIRFLGKHSIENIDLIITDPPYFDQVAYSEYLVPWQFFMGTRVNLENEIVQSNRKDGHQTREKYLQGMREAFKTVAEQSVPGAKLFMYYKDSKLNNISELLDLLAHTGWKFENQIHVNKGNFTYKQNSTKKNTVPGDCLLIFTLGSKTEKPIQKFNSTELRDAEIIKLIEKSLIVKKSITVTQLYDEILVPNLYHWGHLSDFKSPGEILEILNSICELDEEGRSIKLK